MAKEIKKTVRITSEMDSFISDLAKSLNISENDVVKMIFFNFMRGLK